MVGPTNQGMAELIDRDPSAYWDTYNNKVVSTITPARASSPSRCSIPSTTRPANNGRNADLKAVNYMGFFVEEMQGNNVVGRITPVGGILTGNGGPAPVGAFPIAIVLVK